MGHNSSVNTDTAKRLLSIIERIEALEAERKNLGQDIKDIYWEAKSAGFDAPTIRLIIKHRAEDAAKREEREALLETYMAALGQLADTPLGKAATERF
jgi:uncharacterized protein (UPF0335 family)